MAQASLANCGWDFEVHRGPDWLFVRPRRIAGRFSGGSTFAEHVWALLEQQFTHRLVLEMDDVDHLDSQLISQMLWLYKRIHTRDGMMRVCGLSMKNQEVLHVCRLEGHFPCYRTCEEAVMGHVHPRQPR